MNSSTENYCTFEMNGISPNKTGLIIETTVHNNDKDIKFSHLLFLPDELEHLNSIENFSKVIKLTPSYLFKSRIAS